MELSFALLHGAGFLAIGFGIALPAWRHRLANVVAVIAVATVVAAIAGPATRELGIVHTFSAYEQFTIVAKDFVVDSATAPGWQWGALYGAFALLWAAWLFAARDGTHPRNGFFLPLLLAWSGCALILALQKLAAPGAVVQPWALDRVTYPACLAAALIFARSCQKIMHVVFLLVVCIFATKLPLALFSKLASDGGWGTSLDISSITVFVNPLAQIQVETESGSLEQQGWLIWSHHLLFLPAFYGMSLVGVAFGVFMFLKHPAEPTADNERARST